MTAMIRLFFIITFAILLGCSTKPVSSQNPDFMKQIFERYPELKNKPMSVTSAQRVVDGDTFQTTSGEKVRLIGVNTPESVGKVEAYGKAASDYSKKMLTGKTVYLFQDAGNTDKYGRLLRYVFLSGEPVMYNERLAREGYANTMTVPPNVMYQKLFLQAEREAREHNRGLWATDAPSSLERPAAACKDPKIKGNINTKGEKIYHMPGGKSYDQTVPEQLFCTENEAEAAGFRKAGK